MSYRTINNKMWIWFFNRDMRLYSEINKINILVEQYQKKIIIPSWSASETSL